MNLRRLLIILILLQISLVQYNSSPITVICVLVRHILLVVIPFIILLPRLLMIYAHGYGGTYEFTFYVPFSTDGTPTNKSCAAVTVERYYHINNNLGGIEYPYTDITSAGYNIGYNRSKHQKIALVQVQRK